MALETRNIILIGICIFLGFIVAFIILRQLLGIFKKRVDEVNFTLPDLNEVEKDNFWEVKNTFTFTKYKSPNQQVIQANQSEREQATFLDDFKETFDFKRKLTVRKLPNNLLEVRNEKEVAPIVPMKFANVPIKEELVQYKSKDDVDFEDFFEDLKSEMKKITGQLPELEEREGKNE